MADEDDIPKLNAPEESSEAPAQTLPEEQTMVTEVPSEPELDEEEEDEEPPPEPEPAPRGIAELPASPEGPAQLPTAGAVVRSPWYRHGSLAVWALPAAVAPCNTSA